MIMMFNAILWKIARLAAMLVAGMALAALLSFAGFFVLIAYLMERGRPEHRGSHEETTGTV